MDKNEIKAMLDACGRLRELLELAAGQDNPLLLAGAVAAEAEMLAATAGDWAAEARAGDCHDDCYYVADAEDEADAGEAETGGGTCDVEADTEVSAETPAAAPRVAPAVTRPAKERPVARPAFSVNDRFRFRRSLFGNSDAEMGAALTALTGMDTYAEAEEFFYDELSLKPEDPTVEEFMATVRRYFKTRDASKDNR